jgi:hypothetical protein
MYGRLEDILEDEDENSDADGAFVGLLVRFVVGGDLHIIPEGLLTVKRKQPQHRNLIKLIYYLKFSLCLCLSYDDEMTFSFVSAACRMKFAVSRVSYPLSGGSWFE